MPSGTTVSPAGTGRTAELRLCAIIAILFGLLPPVIWTALPTLRLDISPDRIQPYRGASYAASLPAPLRYILASDSLDMPERSSLVVYENGMKLGPAHALHYQIRDGGHGAYSHWNRALIFSSSDNTDPRTNGRRYSIEVATELNLLVLWPGLLLAGFAGAVGARRWYKRHPGAAARLWLSLRSQAAACLTYSRLKIAFANCLLVVASVTASFGSLEVFLRIKAAAHRAEPPAASMTLQPRGGHVADVPEEIIAAAMSRYRHITMPEEWKRTPAQVHGAEAFHWHGALHVVNADGMRRSTPFPAKQPGVYRVIVVGDSLTYGVGIPEEATFTSALNRHMGRDFAVEFLNLGVSGYQSEDVLKVIRKFVPVLQPDLVIYAVCLNDFLPAGKGQYSFAYEFPLPGAVKKFFLDHTLSGTFLSEAYDGALRRLHLRRDFFDDILQDFEGYQKRFGHDVDEMNRVVQAASLPPMLAMVLDQNPIHADRGYRISRIAESALSKAGMDVIPTEDYYRQFHHTDFKISHWEGHPNEVANYIWASMILKKLQSRTDLLRFRRQ